MAITIKELLASDTISEAADKINFNFDQLLLNGGGPVGPNGPQGPIGPIGGRGIRGTQWYEDPTSSPGTNPNSLTFADLEEGDNYLQSDGTVWEWNGTVWVATAVNLTGPQGSAGTSGFSRFGNPINNQQSIYISPMPGGTAAGADNFNEAVPALVVGGFVSITPTTSGVTYQESLINDSIAQQFESTNSAMIIHQLNSNSSAIRFMGGNNGSDNYEQLNLSNLAFITLDNDDRLRVQVPKAPISTGSLIALSGWTVNTIETGQYYTAGKHIHFITGQSTNSSGSAFENSDFNVQVNKSPGTSGNPRIRLNVTTTGGGLAAGIDIGSNTAVPASTANTGSIIVTGGLIGLVGSSTISLITSSNISQQATGNIALNSGAAVSVTATGNISLSSNNTIQLTAVNDLTVNITDDITINGGDNMIVNITDDIDIDAGNDITISADEKLDLLAKRRVTPNITSGGPAGVVSVPTLGVSGSVHLDQNGGTYDNTQVNASLDANILLSGEFGFTGDGTTTATGFGRFTGNWMRVGNVIFVTGYIFDSPSGGSAALTCTGSTLTIPLPLKGQAIDSPPTVTSGAYGIGNINNPLLVSVAGKSDQVVISTSGTANKFNVTAVDTSINFATDAGAPGIRISFSYRLTT